jgi:hypothetical protein
VAGFQKALTVRWVLTYPFSEGEAVLSFIATVILFIQRIPGHINLISGFHCLHAM